MKYPMSGKIPMVYDTHVAPVLFEPFAREIVGWLPELRDGNVLEIACGTGRATRQLRNAFPGEVHLVASDLSREMIAYAQSEARSAFTTDWLVADAHALPFPDNLFECVVCQFGAMFFEDRVAAFKEVNRVSKQDSTFVLWTWDRLNRNPLCAKADAAVKKLLPESPPKFFEVPFGWNDPMTIRSELLQAGFSRVHIETVKLESLIADSASVAYGFAHANPVMHLMSQQLPGIIERYEELLASEFDSNTIWPMSAHIIVCRKS